MVRSREVHLVLDVQSEVDNHQGSIYLHLFIYQSALNCWTQSLYISATVFNAFTSSLFIVISKVSQHEE